MYRVKWHTPNSKKIKHTIWFDFDKCIIMAQSIANGGDVVVGIEAKL